MNSQPLTLKELARKYGFRSIEECAVAFRLFCHF